MYQIKEKLHPMKAVLYCLFRLRLKDALSIFDFNYRNVEEFKSDFLPEDFQIYYPDDDDCDHTGAYTDTGGWHCPKCGANKNTWSVERIHHVPISQVDKVGAIRSKRNDDFGENCAKKYSR